MTGRGRGTVLYCADASEQSGHGGGGLYGVCRILAGCVQRAHCPGCPVTFEDEVLFDAPRLTGRCVPPECLDLVAVGQVWCRC